MTFRRLWSKLLMTSVLITGADISGCSKRLKAACTPDARATSRSTAGGEKNVGIVVVIEIGQTVGHCIVHKVP